MSLIIEDITTGQGKEAEKGKEITVHYTGWLQDGTKFDSSLDRRQPLTIVLGAGQVIQGWDEGFSGMKEGGKRKLTIPPEMGYGARGAGGVIPPNATLVFEVELLQSKRGIGKFKAVAKVDGQVAAEAEIMCAKKVVG